MSTALKDNEFLQFAVITGCLRIAKESIFTGTNNFVSYCVLDEQGGDLMAECKVCFRHCDLKEGQTGFCGGRICADGRVHAKNYGRITSLALDPVEKKPLRRFFPGRQILSVGSYGCNLRCPFCQNSEISWSDQMKHFADDAQFVTPEELVRTAREKLQYVYTGNC